jgi:flagellar hook-associated protein 1 FlgK
MGTISSAFSLMSQALDNDQAALNVVSNNVANASTPGYTEETPTWRENPPVTIAGNTYGMGATETGAASQRDRVLEQRLNQQQQMASGSGARLTALNAMQALFTPATGTGSAGDIGSDITGFFASFSSLEANPTDNALRQEVLSSASMLAGDVANAAASLNAQRTALDQEASGIVGQVNSLTQSLAQLNLQIQSSSPEGDAGVLEDQRQQDLSQLAKLIGINQVTTENNGLSVTTTGRGRRRAGRIPDRARQRYSAGGRGAGPVGVWHLDRGEYPKSCGHRFEWGGGSRYFLRAGAGGGKCGGNARDHDRSGWNCGGCGRGGLGG